MRMNESSGGGVQLRQLIHEPNSIFAERDTPYFLRWLNDNGLPLTADDTSIEALMHAPHTGVIRPESQEVLPALDRIDQGLYTPLAHALGARAIAPEAATAPGQW